MAIDYAPFYGFWHEKRDKALDIIMRFVVNLSGEEKQELLLAIEDYATAVSAIDRTDP